MCKCLAILAFIFVVACTPIKSEVPENNLSRLTNNDLESIRRGMETSKNKVFDEYYSILKQYPEAKGIIKFKLEVYASGLVKSIRLIETDFNMPELEGRLLSIVKKIKFSPLTKQTRVEYSFNFLPN